MPPLGSFKINYDDASKGNLGPSGIGTLIFDQNGKLVIATCKKVSNGTNNKAKLKALSLGLDLCNQT